MIDFIFLIISTVLFIVSIALLLYDVLSPKIDRTVELGKDLPKFTGLSLLLIILALIMLVIVSLPYMMVSVSI